jgi:hypothetical protein
MTTSLETSDSDEEEPIGSEVPDDSDDRIEVSTAPVIRSPGKKEKQFSEGKCHRQLAMLRTEDRRLPPTMTKDVFATVFRLSQDGVNTHKLRIAKDISLAEVEALFGKEKARNGFSVAEKLSPTLRKEAEKLYCLCY